MLAPAGKIAKRRYRALDLSSFVDRREVERTARQGVALAFTRTTRATRELNPARVPTTSRRGFLQRVWAGRSTVRQSGLTSAPRAGRHLAVNVEPPPVYGQSEPKAHVNPHGLPKGFVKVGVVMVPRQMVDLPWPACQIVPPTHRNVFHAGIILSGFDGFDVASHASLSQIQTQQRPAASSLSAPPRKCVSTTIAERARVAVRQKRNQGASRSQRRLNVESPTFPTC